MNGSAITNARLLEASRPSRDLLIPLEKSSILGSRAADANSNMCYQIPRLLTTDGRAIPGGTDIGKIDRQIAAKLYPKAVPAA